MEERFMENREGKIIMGIVITMAIFMLLDAVQSGYDESKAVIGQEELPIKQTNVLEKDTGHYPMEPKPEADESTAGDIDAQESIPEKDTPKEAIIDMDRIDGNLLDRLKYEVADEKEIINGFMRENKIIMDKAESYSAVKGVTCFRGNHHRDSASYGDSE